MPFPGVCMRPIFEAVLEGLENACTPFWYLLKKDRPTCLARIQLNFQYRLISIVLMALAKKKVGRGRAPLHLTFQSSDSVLPDSDDEKEVNQMRTYSLCVFGSGLRPNQNVAHFFFRRSCWEIVFGAPVRSQTIHFFRSIWCNCGR